MSVSSLRLLHIFEAVCLTMEPTDLREMTIPSTRGVARFILVMEKCKKILNIKTFILILTFRSGRPV